MWLAQATRAVLVDVKVSDGEEWRKSVAIRASKSSTSWKMSSRAAESISFVRHAESLCTCSVRYENLGYQKFQAIEIRLSGHRASERVPLVCSLAD